MRGLFLIALLIGVIFYDVYASVSDKLKQITGAPLVKFVYCYSGGAPFGTNKYRKMFKIMKYSTDTNKEDTLVGALSSYFRPLITHDGNRVVFTDLLVDSGVVIIDWNGTNKRKLLRGTAGALYYDKIKKKEYVVCTKSWGLNDVGGVFLVNIDDTSDNKMILDSATVYNNRQLQPQYLSISSNAEYVGVKWNTGGELIQLPHKKVVRSSGGHYPFTPYDTSKLIISRSSDNFYSINVVGGQTPFSVIVCDSAEIASGDCQIISRYNQFRPVYRNPGFMVCIHQQDELDDDGPGRVVLFKMSESFNAILGRVQIHDNNFYGYPDVWFESKTQTVEPKSIVVQTPNGGEQWEEGNQVRISWATTGAIDSVVIGFTYDGIQWNILKTDTNRGEYIYKVPSGISSNRCLIRVCDKADLSICDQSNSVFTIKAKIVTPSITVLAPINGDRWLEGTKQLIRWSITGEVGIVEIKISKDGGSTWTKLGTVQDSLVYTINIPAASAAESCVVEVRSLSNPSVFGRNEGFFSIQSPPSPEKAKIFLTSPNGGETWIGGKTWEIVWTSSGNIDSVIIKISHNNGKNWYNIATVANTGSYNYKVPTDINSSQCRVKISAKSDTSIYDQSDLMFTVSSGSSGEPEAASITLVSPREGDLWEFANQYQISWTSSGPVPSVIIYFSTDSGVNWKKIATGSNKGSIQITPQKEHKSANAFIKVCSSSDTTICGRNIGPFTIGSTFKLISKKPIIHEQINMLELAGIQYYQIHLVKESDVTIEIYSVSGKLLQRIKERFIAGSHLIPLYDKLGVRGLCVMRYSLGQKKTVEQKIFIR